MKGEDKKNYRKNTLFWFNIWKKICILKKFDLNIFCFITKSCVTFDRWVGVNEWESEDLNLFRKDRLDTQTLSIGNYEYFKL